MKTLNLGINGFGRIGRIVFRAAINRPHINIVAINDLLDIKHIAYLLKYDSVHGRFNGTVKIEGDKLIVNNKPIRITAEKDPKNLKWDAVKTQVVAECTGIFKTQETAGKHIEAGAKKVVVSSPSSDVPMFVMGVNHIDMKESDKIVSNASCTTNCLAPIAQIIHENYGIEEALMTTVHATTASQMTVDGASSKNYRLGRSALNNIIPTSTGAAKAVGRVIPELNNKLTGMAFRVPVSDVSVVDMTVKTLKQTSLKEIKALMKSASEGKYLGIVGYTEDGVVSQDFIGDPRTAIFDADASIELNSTFFKLIAWYDNEYGYSSKLVDMAEHINTL